MPPLRGRGAGKAQGKCYKGSRQPSQPCISSMPSQPFPHLSGIIAWYFLNYYLSIYPNAMYAYSLFRSGEKSH